MILIVVHRRRASDASLPALQPTPARRKSQSPELRRDSAINWVAHWSRRTIVKAHDASSSCAVSGGYRAAQVDLAGLLVDASAGPSDHARAVSLYEKAWQDGVPIAAFELGQLYEQRRVARQPDQSKAWSGIGRAPISANPTRSHDSESATTRPPSPRVRRRRRTHSCSRLSLHTPPLPSVPRLKAGPTTPGDTGAIAAPLWRACSRARG